MLKLSIEDLKLEFVRIVYEAITKQIQQMDLKISIILSWNGAMAVILAKQITDLIHNRNYDVLSVLLLAAIVISMGFTSTYSYRVLKPRKAHHNGPQGEGFAGLLFAGDILNLGKGAGDRISAYSAELLKIETHEELYRQFTKSIVLISEVQMNKNRLFTRALMGSVLSFILLLAVMMVMGVFEK